MYSKGPPPRTRLAAISQFFYKGRRIFVPNERHNCQTGDWSLRSPEFSEWLHDSQQLQLFCATGVPDSGKTMLTSIVLEFLSSQHQNVPIGYIFCDHKSRAKCTRGGLLSSILRQFLRPYRTRTPEIRDWYDRLSLSNLSPESQHIHSFIHSLLQQQNNSFIITDALDEYGNDETVRNRQLDHIFKLSDAGRIYVMMPCRPNMVHRPNYS